MQWHDEYWIYIKSTYASTKNLEKNEEKTNGMKIPDLSFTVALKLFLAVTIV